MNCKRRAVLGPAEVEERIQQHPSMMLVQVVENLTNMTLAGVDLDWVEPMLNLEHQELDVGKANEAIDVKFVGANERLLKQAQVCLF